MKIEVWSDFVCPFCYIGKRRLEHALDQFPHKDDVEIEYRSYELDPNAEKNPGKSIHELMAEKFGTDVEKAKQSNEQIGKQAAEVGLVYNFDTMKHTNTFDAHRVAQYAETTDRGNEITERLLKAYFTDSKFISDVAELLKTNAYAAQVRFDEKQAQEIGVQGVPFFVFNEKYAVSGAQPTEVFLEALEKVWEEEREKPALQSLNPKHSPTTYCT